GTVSATPKYWKRLRSTAQQLGQTISPDDAYLALRGLRTMGVRLERHEKSALEIAHWLKDQPQVVRVLHPAFEDCPGHEIWKRDFTGSAGLFSIELTPGGDDAAIAALIDDLRLYGLGYSWGGYESLALPVDPRTARSATAWEGRGPLIRLNIGLEDTGDLIADLAAGLERYEKAACRR
ncbi:MAG: PLP-dependent transferase, partial [Parasphingopyxis sp.]|uniref:PLP-dependent transferase n=1 Tax=Parasphingopyxis sp. TaxID=1920299 RepID=UPI0032EB9A9F